MAEGGRGMHRQRGEGGAWRGREGMAGNRNGKGRCKRPGASSYARSKRRQGMRRYGGHRGGTGSSLNQKGVLGGGLESKGLCTKNGLTRCSQFRFFPRWSLWSRGGGRGGLGVCVPQLKNRQMFGGLGVGGLPKKTF